MLKQETASQVIDHAIALGADFVDLFVERNQTGSVSTLSEKVQSVESGIDFGIGVRLVFGTKVLYGYTNKAEVAELQRIASELAAKDLRDPATSSEPFNFIEVTDRHEASIPLSQDSSFDEIIAYLLSANQYAKNASNQISQTRGFCNQRQQFVEIFNSEGPVSYTHLRAHETRHDLV